MMIRSLAWLVVALALPAGARAEEAAPPAAEKKSLAVAEVVPAREVPKQWHDALAASLPNGQVLVQTLVGDLDGDGKDEWVAIGEPKGRSTLGVSAAIFQPAKGKTPPKLIFSQRLIGEAAENRRPTRAGAAIVRVSPVGQGLLLLGAHPQRNGNSRFVLQLYGTRDGRYVPLVPGELAFFSQGGFAIEDLDPSNPGHEIATWSYYRGKNEQLHDRHHYHTAIYRWDGRRFLSPDYLDHTEEKMESPAAAARTMGVKSGDWRRRIPRVAEVP